jgi:hypothetical protein
MNYPPALTEKEWNSLIKKLNTSPTPEQKKLIQDALKNGKRIKTNT